LTFFLFKHVAIFSKKGWPKEIGVNGWVRVDGEKMSKSIGNIIPLREMNEKYGADASRLTILNGGEGLDDPNWDTGFAENLKWKFGSIKNFTEKSMKTKTKMGKIDSWMQNKLAFHVKEATDYMEKTLFRSAIQKIYFDLISDLKWYLRRTNNPNKKVISDVFESLITMMQPFTPHLAEELWEKLGNKGFVSLEKWPEFKYEKKEDTELLIKNLISDIKNLKHLVKKEIKKAYVYVVPKELETYKEAEDFIDEEIGLQVKIYSVNDRDKYDPISKSGKAKLGKPAVYLE
jgi:leucyl-tRNA synthetase